MNNKYYGCIYKTTNLINGKMYIGQTTYPERVINKKYFGSGIAINNAINKYGRSNFKSEIICYAKDKEELNLLEQQNIIRYITISPNGYNLMSGGAQGGRHGEDSRKRISENNLGEKNGMYSVRLLGDKNGMYGKTHTQSVRDIISLNNLGKSLSEESKRKISESNTGKKRSEKFCKRNSEINKGKSLSEETKRKISESKVGVPNYKGRLVKRTEEQKEHLRRLNTGKVQSIETRNKISDLLRGENHPLFGKPCSEERRNNISTSLKNKPPIFCPQCNISSINRANMKRYHFNNCKKNNENQK